MTSRLVRPGSCLATASHGEIDPTHANPVELGEAAAERRVAHQTARSPGPSTPRSRLQPTSGPAHNPNNPWCGAELLLTPDFRLWAVSARWTLPNHHSLTNSFSTWVGVGFLGPQLLSRTQGAVGGWFLSAGFDFAPGSNPTRFVEYWFNDDIKGLGELKTDTDQRSPSQGAVGDTVGVAIVWQWASSFWYVYMINYTQNIIWPYVTVGAAVPADIRIESSLEQSEQVGIQARWAVEALDTPSGQGEVGSWGKVVFDGCTCLATPLAQAPFQKDFLGSGAEALQLKLQGNPKSSPCSVFTQPETASSASPGTAAIRMPACVVCQDATYFPGSANHQGLSSAQGSGPAVLTNYFGPLGGNLQVPPVRP
jgi:hypothetical protein